MLQLRGVEINSSSWSLRVIGSTGIRELMKCFICGSENHIDNHHYDCCYGQVSPETVPLCRRCHTSYHVWGVGCFAPQDTAKALEVENRRREILRSLPADHIRYKDLPELHPEDVEHSDYWYKKHGIKKPHTIPDKEVFRLSCGIPLCGKEWLAVHLKDHTIEEIEALGIQISVDGKQVAEIKAGEKKGTIKRLIREALSR